jgi:hypothetical protein
VVNSIAVGTCPVLNEGMRDLTEDSIELFIRTEQSHSNTI